MDEGIGDILFIYLEQIIHFNVRITYWNIGTSNFLFYVNGNLFMLILIIDGYVIYIINLFKFCLIMLINKVFFSFVFVLMKLFINVYLNYVI